MLLLGVLAMGLSGCGVINWLFGIEESQEEESPPAPYSKGLDLVGTWVYHIRIESSVIVDVAVKEGRLVITEESCLQDQPICTLSGYVQFVKLGLDAQYPVMGSSYPEAKLVRFTYSDRSPNGDPVTVLTVFDIFPEFATPERAMVGYSLMFNPRYPGLPGDDLNLLIAAGRGMLTQAGRASAWPIP